MNDFDDRARAAGERIRRDAADLAATTDALSQIHASSDDGHPHRGRGWLLAAACVAVVALGFGGLVVTRGKDSPATIDDSGTPSPATTTDPSGPATTMSGDPTVPGAVTEPSDPPTTAPPTSPPDPTTLVRPIIDPDVCAPLTSRSAPNRSLPRWTGAFDFTLFARPSERPIPIQIIGDPVDGQAKPFAIVLRHFDREQSVYLGDDPVTINGVDVSIETYPNGNGEAEWTLADGSQGYLRSRGLDQGTIESILTELSPRPDDAAVPGFDYTAVRPGLVLVGEQLNTEVDTTSFTGSQCTMSVGTAVYRVSAVRGDPAYTFGAVIDRPPPVDVGVVGDTTVIISGPTGPDAPSVDDVISADAELWDELPPTPDEPTSQGHEIGGDREVTVELVPVDDTSTPVSTLTLKVDEAEGVGFLEIYTRDAVIADAGEYWQTENDGGNGGISSAGPVGSVMGFRLGDAPITEPFTVRVSTIDGDGFTIQTTGEIHLVPVPD